MQHKLRYRYILIKHVMPEEGIEKEEKKFNNNFNNNSYMVSTHVVKCGMSTGGFSSKLRNTSEKVCCFC